MATGSRAASGQSQQRPELANIYFHQSVNGKARRSGRPINRRRDKGHPLAEPVRNELLYGDDSNRVMRPQSAVSSCGQPCNRIARGNPTALWRLDRQPLSLQAYAVHEFYSSPRRSKDRQQQTGFFPCGTDDGMKRRLLPRIDKKGGRQIGSVAWNIFGSVGRKSDET